MNYLMRAITLAASVYYEIHFLTDRSCAFQRSPGLFIPELSRENLTSIGATINVNRIIRRIIQRFSDAEGAPFATYADPRQCSYVVRVLEINEGVARRPSLMRFFKGYDQVALWLAP